MTREEKKRHDVGMIFTKLRLSIAHYLRDVKVPDEAVKLINKKFDLAEEEILSLDDWISVEDELPEEEGEYLVYLDRDLKYGRRIAFSTWFRSDWLGVNGSGWPGMPKPKYWQPLLTKPKGEDK